MNSLHKLYSEDTTKVNAVLYNGKVISAGPGRGFKTAIEFSNDSYSADSSKSFADINCDSFTTNELSIAFWIHPKNESYRDAPIFMNEHNDKTTGIFYNCGSTSEGHLGICWDDDKNTTPHKLGINITNAGWVHFAFIFEKTGMVKVFGNGKYLQKVDMGRGFEKVNFSNMRIGGFTGWLDDFKVYHYPLKYGNVNLNENATQNIAYIFNTSRKTGNFSIPVDIDAKEKNEPFYYLQDEEYVKAHQSYNLETQNNQDYYNDESKHPIIGGVNDGKLQLADGDFRTFLGKIYAEPLEEDK